MIVGNLYQFLYFNSKCLFFLLDETNNLGRTTYLKNNSIVLCLTNEIKKLWNNKFLVGFICLYNNQFVFVDDEIYKYFIEIRL